jgi:hypothetical protein
MKPSRSPVSPEVKPAVPPSLPGDASAGELLDGEEALKKEGPFMAYWKKIGGGSFTISLLLHVLFLIAAILIVWTTSNAGTEENIDFLSGGWDRVSGRGVSQGSRRTFWG